MSAVLARLQRGVYCGRCFDFDSVVSPLRGFLLFSCASCVLCVHRVDFLWKSNTIADKEGPSAAESGVVMVYRGCPRECNNSSFYFLKGSQYFVVPVFSFFCLLSNSSS